MTNHNNQSNNPKNEKFFSGVKLIIAFYIFGYIIADISHYKKMNDDVYQYSSLINSEDELSQIMNTLEDDFDIEIPEDKKDEFLLINAIRNNSNLNENEKNVFYGYYSIIEDCMLLNKKEAYESFSKVDVVYSQRPENSTESILGDYSYKSGIINIYQDHDNKVLIHEGLHCMFFNPITEKLPTYFTEGVTEILANEYFSEDPFYENENYPYEVAYVKMLCELVGSDLVLEAYCTGNFSLITDYIDKYNDTKLSANEIIEVYERRLQSLTEKNRDDLPVSLEQEALNSLDKIYCKVDPSLKNYQAFRYYCSLSCSIFYENPAKFYAKYIGNQGIIQKAYFSKELKERYKDANFVSFGKRDKVLVKTKFAGN